MHNQKVFFTICFTIFVLTLFVQQTFALILPQPQGMLNDFANMVDATSKEQITKLLTDIRDTTTVEIAVVTIDTLEGVPKEDYAIELAQTWGVGKKENDNGIVILIAQQERQYRIEVGRGLEGVLTDAQAGRIGRNTLVPNFQKNQYGKGVYQALLEIQGLLKNDPDVVARYSAQEGMSFFSFFAFGYLILTFIISFISFQKKKVSWYFLAGWNIPLLALAFFFGFLLLAIILLIFSTIAAFCIRYGQPTSPGTGRDRGVGGFSDRDSRGSSFGGGNFSGGGAGGGW